MFLHFLIPKIYSKNSKLIRIFFIYSLIQISLNKNSCFFNIRYQWILSNWKIIEVIMSFQFYHTDIYFINSYQFVLIFLAHFSRFRWVTGSHLIGINPVMIRLLIENPTIIFSLRFYVLSWLSDISFKYWFIYLFLLNLRWPWQY